MATKTSLTPVLVSGGVDPKVAVPAKRPVMIEDPSASAETLVALPKSVPPALFAQAKEGTAALETAAVAARPPASRARAATRARLKEERGRESTKRIDGGPFR